MDNEEIKRKKREEEDYYDKKAWELPTSDFDANRRYEQYVCKDPFPMIETALLNSADIFQYVAKTGMIYPFHPQKLEGASYEVALRGTVIWWDESTKEQREKKIVKPDDSFELKPNSIAFVTLEPMFRIPDYMALRFNLKIIHVYKGLLLGTGPLVDPGFIGRLSIPLHNLTANTYTFHAGEGIIQMEFTKLSRNYAWLTGSNPSQYLYKRKWIKPGRTVKNYIGRAMEGSDDKVVKSSIPDEISKIIDQSKDLKDQVTIFNHDTQKDIENFKRTSKEESEHFTKETKEDIGELRKTIEERLNRTQLLNAATVISIAVLVISVLAYAGNSIYQLGSSLPVKQATIDDINEKYNELKREYGEMQNALNAKITELENRLESLECDNTEEVSVEHED